MDIVEPNRKFEVDNVIIEPGATSTKFLVYGKRGESGVMYHLDFSVMGVPACQQAWQPGSATSDYFLWTPTDTKNSDGCLMGKVGRGEIFLESVASIDFLQISGCYN